MRRIIPLFGVGFLAALSCKSGSSFSPQATTLTIAPSPVSLAGAGSAQQLTATVRDQNGDPMSGAAVTWSTANAAVATVSTAGLVTAVAVGTTHVKAVSGNAVDSVAVTVTTASGTIAVFAGNGQTGLAGYALNVAPAVLVKDSFSAPMPGVAVTFAVTGGGGSVSGGSATTDANGIARVGAWTVQLGANTLSATAAGFGGSPLTFTATGQAAQYHIDVRIVGTMTTAQKAAFTQAAARWETLIYGDVPNVTVNKSFNACQIGEPAMNETVDDIVIFARLDSIDGPGKVVGQAGPCMLRSTGLLPAVGVMMFDSADVAGLISTGQWDEVALHEMGHVLGYGTLWGSGYLNLLVGPYPSGSTDPHFVGSQAIAAFDRVGGTAYAGGAKVPVENCQGLPVGLPCDTALTANGHWRETVFGSELMTGYLNPSVANPLSVVSVASMGDEGYTVNYAGADSYTLTAAAAAGAPPAFPVTPLFLGNDILRIPISVIDPSGRVLRVIPPR